MGGENAEESMGAELREQDERFMRDALEEAQAAAAEGEVPIGAVVVHEGRVIARAHNRRELDEDPSAHAEFRAMVAAARELGRWRLTGCTVYVTLEPCLMCAGLMVNARIDRCVFGAFDPKGGAVGSLFNVSDDRRLNHSFSVTSGVLEGPCAEQLRSFFAERRAGGGIVHVDAVAPEPGGAVSDKLQDIDDNRPCDVRSGVIQAVDAFCRPFRVLLAIDSFKGSASSFEVESWVAEGICHASPRVQIAQLPLADGGEGTVDALHRVLGGTIVRRRVAGPLDDPVEASYLLVGEGEDVFAAIEMAEAAGITYSPCTHEAALRADPGAERERGGESQREAPRCRARALERGHPPQVALAHPDGAQHGEVVRAQKHARGRGVERARHADGGGSHAKGRQERPYGAVERLRPVRLGPLVDDAVPGGERRVLLEKPDESSAVA